MLYYLIYISQATKLMDENELALLLVESRAWNEEHGLTGMLAYIEGVFSNTHIEARFMQVLEGTEYEVLRIFNKIKTDSRHHHITLLIQDELEKRNFSEWHMKFESINIAANPELYTFFNLNNNVLSSNAFKTSDAALEFLKAF